MFNLLEITALFLIIFIQLVNIMFKRKAYEKLKIWKENNTHSYEIDFLVPSGTKVVPFITKGC